jgi:hypothetical protein
MDFTLVIRATGSAFAEEPEREIARLLREAADRIEPDGLLSGTRVLVDINGNTCGSWGVAE